MVESVTMSLAAGIIAVVLAVMTLRRALKRRALRPRRMSQPDARDERKAS